MLRNRQFWLLCWLIALLGLVSGCDTGTVEPTPIADSLSDAELASIALESDGLTEAVFDEQLGPMPAVSGNGDASGNTLDVSFTRTRPCPAGGELVVEGTLHRSFDPLTGVMEAHFQATRTRNDCAFVRGEHTITVNGSTQVEAFRRRVDGMFDGPQVTTYAGTIHALRDDGEERSCEFRLEVVRDPETMTRTLRGVVCGRTVHRTAPWHPHG